MSLVIVAVIGCQKDKNEFGDSLVTKSNIAEYDNLKSKVDHFMSKMNNKFKSDEVMSADSATWYIETAINLTYSDGVTTQNLKEYSSTITISSDELSIQDVGETYDIILHDVSEKYYSDNNDEFSFVNISTRTNPDGGVYVVWTCYYPDREVEMTYEPMTYNGFSHENKDYWYAGYKMGKWQGDDEGRYVGKRDATTELTSRYNRWKVAKRGSNYVWTDVTDYLFNENSTAYGTPLNDMLWTNPNNYYGYISNKLTHEYLQHCYEDIVPSKINSELNYFGSDYYCFWMKVNFRIPGKINPPYQTITTDESKTPLYYEYHELEFKIGKPVLRGTSPQTMPRF